MFEIFPRYDWGVLWICLRFAWYSYSLYYSWLRLEANVTDLVSWLVSDIMKIRDAYTSKKSVVHISEVVCKYCKKCTYFMNIVHRSNNVQVLYKYCTNI